MLPVNCDLGEYNHHLSANPEDQIFPHIQMCNIACGFHAGGPVEMMHSLQMASKYGVKVGAHPSFPDVLGFGRDYIDLPHDDLINIILYQITALDGMARAAGIPLYHVKAHGALYNAAMKMEKEAQAIITAVKKANYNLVILCQPQSVLSEVANHQGIAVMTEGFADRLYDEDLSLVSRQQSGSVLDSEEKILRQIKGLNEGYIITRNGEKKVCKVDTVCIHSDNKASIETVKKLMLKL